jgi:hypothetical protein
MCKKNGPKPVLTYLVFIVKRLLLFLTLLTPRFHHQKLSAFHKLGIQGNAVHA